MRLGEWWRGAGLALGAAAMLAVAGCGADIQQQQDEGDGIAATSSAATAPPTLNLSPEEIRLNLYWMLDRYILDGGLGPRVHADFKPVLLAKAGKDECYLGIGQPSVVPNPDGTCPAHDPPYTPKVNDAYVWGLTTSGDSLYFGTLANTHCLVESSYLGVNQASQTAEWVCEFGARTPALGPDNLVVAGMPGDFRPPNLYRYDRKAKQLTSLAGQLDATAEGLRRYPIGLRSAGALGDVVFLAGPYARGGGITMFAIDGSTGTVLGAQVVNNPTTPYTNVRMWRVAKGALYVGVGTTAGGAILRWTGTKSAPFQFVEVGHLPSDAANMTVHDDDRLYVSTWPSRASPAGVYRSPVIKKDGLTAADADAADWKTPLWLATDYEPDRAIAQTYGGGAIQSWNGKLVFGTMHVPGTSLQAAQAAHTLDANKLLQNFLGTSRAISVYQITFKKGQPKVEMLYGERYVPMYDATQQAYTIRYDKAHRTGFEPKMGPSGLGTFFNAYTWSMEVYRGELFIGTFDWSQLAVGALGSFGSTPQLTGALTLLGGLNKQGADVVRMLPNGGVVFESNSGEGNDRNYGIRNMLVDQGKLYLGTANPMNLDPKGGWELLQLKSGAGRDDRGDREDEDHRDGGDHHD